MTNIRNQNKRSAENVRLDKRYDPRGNIENYYDFFEEYHQIPSKAYENTQKGSNGTFRSQETQLYESLRNETKRSIHTLGNKLNLNQLELQKTDNKISSLTEQIESEKGLNSINSDRLKTLEIELKQANKTRENLAIREVTLQSEIKKSEKVNKKTNKKLDSKFRNLQIELDSVYNKYSPLRWLSNKLRKFNIARRLQVYRIQNKMRIKREARMLATNIAKATSAKVTKAGNSLLKRINKPFLAVERKIGKVWRNSALKNSLDKSINKAKEKAYIPVKRVIRRGVGNVSAFFGGIGKRFNAAKQTLTKKITKLVKWFLITFWWIIAIFAVVGLVFGIFVSIMGSFPIMDSNNRSEDGQIGALERKWDNYYIKAYNPGVKFMKDYRVVVDYTNVISVMMVTGNKDGRDGIDYDYYTDDEVYDIYEYFLDELKERYTYWMVDWSWNEFEQEVDRVVYDNPNIKELELIEVGNNWVEFLRKRKSDEVINQTVKNNEEYCALQSSKPLEIKKCLTESHIETEIKERFYVTFKTGVINGYSWTGNSQDPNVMKWSKYIHYDMNSLALDKDANWEAVFANSQNNPRSKEFEDGNVVTKRTYYWTVKTMEEVADELIHETNPIVLPEGIIKKGRANDPIEAVIDVKPFYKSEYDVNGNWIDTTNAIRDNTARKELFINMQIVLSTLYNTANLDFIDLFYRPLRQDIVNISSPFGPRGNVDASSDTSRHTGTDLVTPSGIGSEIYAAGSGTVVQTYNECSNNSSAQATDAWNCGPLATTNRNNSGNTVIIEHMVKDVSGNETVVYSLYGHLNRNSIRVREGDIVDENTIIAAIGNSGASTGPHLHYGNFKLKDASGSWSNWSNRDYIDSNMSLIEPYGR